MTRDKIRRRMVWWAWADHDRVPESILDSRPYEWFITAIEWIGCKLAGHQPERDQCGIPEHDACTWCRKHMPNQAVTR